MRVPTGLFVSTLILLSSHARAVTQPGSTVPIPLTTRAQGYLDAEEAQSGAIDALRDAKLEPSRFNPGCGLRYKVIARGGGFLNVFGWYNIVPDPTSSGKFLKPPDSDLHALVNCTDGVGTQKDLGDVRASPAYKGGEVGFFLATPQKPGVQGEVLPGNCPKVEEGVGPVAGTYGYIYYSQPEFNPDKEAGGGSSFVHLLLWQSVKHKDSFYFGWEDLFTPKDHFDWSDNDFEDFLARVEGIRCTGGGGACKTGKAGICEDGTMQCVKGDLTCIPNQNPHAEKCNAIDDDCDGVVDNGDLCKINEVCDKGVCRPRCGSGEFACPADKVCIENRGICVTRDCAKVDCPAKEICIKGQCKDACADVVCPYGNRCIGGSCVNVCENIQCDPGYVCDVRYPPGSKDPTGVCIKCSCDGCSSGMVCTSQESCVEDSCRNVTCPTGQHCAKGTCVDNCDQVKCPDGSACEAGVCKEVTKPDGGVGGGGNPGTGGGVVVIDGGSTTGGSSAGGATGTGGETGTGARTGTGAGGSGSETDTNDSAKNCGCSVPGSAAASAGWLLSGLLGLLFASRRKRKN